MTVSLSIKNVPEALAARLRLRATRNHRSLQRELMTIVEEAVAPADERSGGVASAPAAPHYAIATRGEGFPEPAAAWPSAMPGADDGLLFELDAIVAGSRWGDAPMLTREQANDRRLQRELDYDARRNELKPARP